MERRQITYVHLAFWVYILMQHLFPILTYTKLDPLYYKVMPVDLVFSFILFYLLYRLSLPLLFRVKSKVIAGLGGLMLIVCFAAVTLVIYYYYEKLILQLPPEDLLISKADLLNHFRNNFVIGIYALLIRVVVDFLDQQQKEAELRNQTQASEIALLRSQINPHFLFNTLNNIYSLVRSKSEDAPTAVLKLSDIMRYMLYDSNSERVLLSKEVEYLQGFIELQKLRLESPDFVEFSIRGDIASRMIAPMVFIPFVENAFKHGKKKSGEPCIIINLQCTDINKIIFTVENTLPLTSQMNKDTEGGIGLHNIKRRLELLYPAKHTLDISEDSLSYKVKLVLVQ